MLIKPKSLLKEVLSLLTLLCKIFLCITGYCEQKLTQEQNKEPMKTEQTYKLNERF